MSGLPDDYLRYKQRRYGQDHGRYQWRPAHRRRPRALPGGALLGVAVIVPIEFFMLNPAGKPFRHPGAMQTPYPDLRHYTTRDYGNRVGAFRILDALKDAGARATFAVNGAMINRARPLIDAIIEDGHEIAAHGWDTDCIHWRGLDEAAERALVDRTRAAFDAIGLTPRAWMSPARQQSATTPDLIRAAGFDICLDWEIDTVPVALETKAGDLAAFPLSGELDDRILLTVKNHSEDQWRDQIIEAAALLKAEAAAAGALCLGFTLTPYIAGLPFRAAAMRDILSTLALDGATRVDGVSSIIDALQ